MKNNKFVLWVLAPIFVLFFIFMLLPILGGFGIALFDYNPLQAHNDFVGLENFKRLFTDKVFFKSLTNTLVFVAVTVILNVVICLAMSHFITSLPWGKIRGVFRVVFFMPCVAPLVATSVVWRGLFATKYGLVNRVMGDLFGMSPVNWLGNPQWVMTSIIVVTLWADIGYNILLFSAGMDGIPGDFYEAANIDGAGPFSRFFYITLPLLGRTIGFVVAMTLISHFQMFAQFAVLVNRGGPDNSGNVLTYYIYKTAFQTRDMGYASAIAIALFLLILVVTIVQQRLSRVDWGY